MRVFSKICLAIIVLVLVGASKPASADRGPNDVKVLYPNGGETLVIGKRYTIKWTACSEQGRGNVTVTVENGINSWWINTTDDGSHRWKVPTTWKPSTGYKVKGNWYYRCKFDIEPQYDSDGVPVPGQKVYPIDRSNSSFSIAKKDSTPTTGTLKVTTPNGGQKWQKGKSYFVKWSKGNGGTYVDVYLYKAGKYYRTIKSKAKNSGRHRWVIPTSVKFGTQYKIRVQSYTDSDIYDESDRNFTVN